MTPTDPSPTAPGLPCSRCGGPHPYDTSLPSELWNKLEPNGGHLCLNCIAADAVRVGLSFTARLWGDGFNGEMLSVTTRPVALAADPSPADVVARLLERRPSDECPFEAHCYCDVQPPHGDLVNPTGPDAADLITSLQARAETAELERDALQVRLTECQDGSVDLQRHRDHWRSYAYGKRDKPTDFLDGPREPTALEITEAEAATLRKRVEMLEAALCDLTEAARNACDASQHTALIEALFNADAALANKETENV